ncbi:hypothetical protein ACT691_13495 [Vibrio metschnikovii]
MLSVVSGLMDCSIVLLAALVRRENAQRIDLRLSLVWSNGSCNQREAPKNRRA